MPTDSSNRRRSPRIEILGRMHGHVVALGLPVIVREMSLGGLSLEAPMQFPAGAVHDFSLTLGDESAVTLRGRVMYSRESLRPDGSATYVTGIQFVEDEPAPGDSPTVSGIINKITGS